MTPVTARRQSRRSPVSPFARIVAVITILALTLSPLPARAMFSRVPAQSGSQAPPQDLGLTERSNGTTPATSPRPPRRVDPTSSCCAQASTASEHSFGGGRRAQRDGWWHHQIEVGLVYFGARYYSPALMRWVSPDPVTVHAAAGDLNPYAYANGRVVVSVDPNGECEQFGCVAHLLGRETKNGHQDTSGSAWVTCSAETAFVFATAAAASA